MCLTGGGALAGTAGVQGGFGTFSTLQMPKFDSVQPTVEFCTPTSPSFCCSSQRWCLFIASWRDLRRALIMTFAQTARRGYGACGFR